jgi:hypothetical protein
MARGRDILAIQDTCEIGIKTTCERRRGLGEVGKGNAPGVFLHAMIAVDAGTGQSLGLVGGSVCTRGPRRTTCHTERPLEDKESNRWVTTARAGAAILSEAARVTVVADRECDFYVGVVLIAREGPHVLTRSARDRRLMNGGSLYGTLATWPVSATRSLELRAQPGRSARCATVNLRMGTVALRRPDETEAGMPESLSLQVVEVTEPNPPSGIAPGCWRLLTTRAVSNAEEAWMIVGLYQLRWVIE